MYIFYSVLLELFIKQKGANLFVWHTITLRFEGRARLFFLKLCEYKYFLCIVRRYIDYILYV